MTVHLRPLQPSDDADLRLLFADPDTVRWNPGPAPDDLVRWRTENSVHGSDYRTWAVTDADGGFAAIVGVFAIDPAGRTGEIGFRTMPAARGRGVARAAVELACAQLAAEDVVDRLRLYHAVGNVGSCRVATACGFALDEILPQNHRYGDGELHDEHLHHRDLSAGSGR